MASLEHEAVVRVLEKHGIDGGWHYFVMEYIDGGDMRRLVLDKKAQPGQVFSIVLRVGEALNEAHRKGYVHRDVKPANILIAQDGTPKLTDFDLVGGADTTGGTRTGALGTFMYAPPEMLHRPQDAGVTADVYGLGMTVIFGLYGAELPMQVVRNPDKFVDGLPCSDRTKAVLKRAVSWSPRDRHPDAGSFCEALQEAIRPKEKSSLAASFGVAWFVAFLIAIVWSLRQGGDKFGSLPQAEPEGKAAIEAQPSLALSVPPPAVEGSAPAVAPPALPSSVPASPPPSSSATATEPPAQAATAAADAGPPFDEAEAVKALNSAAYAARKCFKSRSSTSFYTVRVTFEPDGKVTLVELPQWKSPDRAVNSCIVSTFRATPQVPTFGGEAVVIERVFPSAPPSSNKKDVNKK
jgi:serine/threonine protein kinase